MDGFARCAAYSRIFGSLANAGCEARSFPKRTLLMPRSSARAWAALVPALEVYVASSLREVVDALNGAADLNRASGVDWPEMPEPLFNLRDVCGQEAAKRSLEVAAAGCHNVLMMGL